MYLFTLVPLFFLEFFFSFSTNTCFGLALSFNLSAPLFFSLSLFLWLFLWTLSIDHHTSCHFHHPYYPILYIPALQRLLKSLARFLLISTVSQRFPHLCFLLFTLVSITIHSFTSIALLSDLNVRLVTNLIPCPHPFIAPVAFFFIDRLYNSFPRHPLRQ